MILLGFLIGFFLTVYLFLFNYSRIPIVVKKRDKDCISYIWIKYKYKNQFIKQSKDLVDVEVD